MILDASSEEREPVPPPAPPRRSWAFLPARFRSASLRTKHVVFTALLTAGVVTVASICVSFVIRSNTRRLLVDGVARTQSALLDQQRRNFGALVRTSGLITENPTLRAALDVYWSETIQAGDRRPDLVATIQNEVDKIVAGIDEELLVVTDSEGRAIAFSDEAQGAVRIGKDLSRTPVVRRAFEPGELSEEEELEVMALGHNHYQVVCVPIILQGFPIGAVLLGERIDRPLVKKLAEFFEGEVVITVGDRVITSTLDFLEPGGPAPDLPESGAGKPAQVMRWGEEEYVMASLPMGKDDTGRQGTLRLLHPLTEPLRRANESLLLILLSFGSAAVLAAGGLAWASSRSTLRPLESFAAFMHSVEESGDHARRFEDPDASREIRTLAQTYNHLMDSLVRTQLQLFGAKEDLSRLDRMKQIEKMAALGRMLAGAAHEINNPMTGVLGNVELLLARRDLKPEMRNGLEKTRLGGQRVVALVRNLLKLSRRGDGKRAALDVNRLIQDAADLSAQEFAQAGVILDVRSSSEPVPVLGSELDLQQVFVNIIRNALEVLKDRGGVPGLEVVCRRESGEIVVTFADNGPGMKEPEKVFEPFYTTKDVGRGTGLGLSICYGVVQEHGGRISAENRPGGGALFTVALPVAEIAAEAAPPAQAEAGTEPAGASASADLAAAAPTSLRGCVLVVEDEADVLELQKQILEGLGVEVAGARSGAEAIRLLCGRDFDVIVSDFKMPGSVSGQDLYEWVLENKPEAAPRFVFVTGDTMGEATRRFLDSVNRRSLEKPFSIEEYVRVVQEVLCDDALVS